MVAAAALGFDADALHVFVHRKIGNRIVEVAVDHLVIAHVEVGAGRRQAQSVFRAADDPGKVRRGAALCQGVHHGDGIALRLADDAAGDGGKVAHQPLGEEGEGGAAGHQRQIGRELPQKVQGQREGHDQGGGAVAQRIEVAQGDAEDVGLPLGNHALELGIGI